MRQASNVVFFGNFDSNKSILWVGSVVRHKSSFSYKGNNSITEPSARDSSLDNSCAHEIGGIILVISFISYINRGVRPNRFQKSMPKYSFLV